MGRKVIKHGPSTLIVSLPSPWVKEMGIKKGDELQCRQEGEQLVLAPEQTAHSQQISLDVRKMEPYLVDRFLARSYQKGYDTILLTHHNLAMLEVIHKKVPELIGFEVMEQTDKTCLIQSIADHPKLDFDTSLRKVFLMLKAMVHDLRTAYHTRDSNLLSTLYLHDFEVNRLAYFCLRCINKGYLKTSVPRYEQKLLYYLCETLEDLGDRIKHIARHLAEQKALNKKIDALLGMLQEEYELAYTYFYKSSIEAANNSLRQHRAISKQFEEIFQTPLSPSEGLALVLFDQASQIISHVVTMRLDSVQEKGTP